MLKQLGNFSVMYNYICVLFNGATDEYFLSRLPVVEKRLAQAGVRLAATLNRIFTSKPSNLTRLNVHNGGHSSNNIEMM